MTKITFHNKFWKIYDKLPKNIQKKTQERITLFSQSPFHPLLKNHKLSGEFRNHHSINITGDYRAIYIENQNNYIFQILGTHSEIYK
jgi:addiction module RelE/StbE family toxin